MSTYIFRCIHKIAKNDYKLRHVCSSVRIEQRETARHNKTVLPTTQHDRQR